MANNVEHGDTALPTHPLMAAPKIVTCKVSVAHLKPVERKMSGQEDEETPVHLNRGTAPSWSFDPAGTNKSNLNDEITRTADEPPHAVGLQRPRSRLGVRENIADHDVFAKEWRHLNKDMFSQMAFLTGIDTDRYPEIFEVELPPNILSSAVVSHLWLDASMRRLTS